MSAGILIAIFFGLIFGSFGSVILSRWASSENLKQASSIISGRSQCPYCKTTLQARDLVPILSFVFQGGKCRYCKKKISRFYPILEIGSAIVFGFVWWYFQDKGIGHVAFRIATGWALWLMVVYSVLWYEIHIPLLLFLCGVLLIGFFSGLYPRSSLRGGVVLFVLFLALYFLGRQIVRFRYHVNEDGMGVGDILMAPYLGTLLFAWLAPGIGWLDKTLAVLYFLIFSGCIGLIRFFLQSTQNKKRAHRFLNAKIANQSLPLLPSMVIAVIIILLYQDTLFGLFMF